MASGYVRCGPESNLSMALRYDSPPPNQIEAHTLGSDWRTRELQPKINAHEATI